MNLAWMAGIAVVFLAEKNWRHGVGLTKVVGIAVLGFGLVVLAHPSVLGSVAPAPARTCRACTDSTRRVSTQLTLTYRQTVWIKAPFPSRRRIM